MRRYPRAAIRRGFGKVQSGGPHAGFAFGNGLGGAWQDHAPGWRGSRAARDLPDDVRIRQASALPLSFGLDEALAFGRGARPARIPGSKPRNPPQARPAVPTLIPPDDGLRRRGLSGGWLGPSRRTGCQRSTPASASPRTPAARYDRARKPSSRPDRSVCGSSGGGSDRSMARGAKAGKIRWRFWGKGLEMLGVELVFVPVLGALGAGFSRLP